MIGCMLRTPFHPFFSGGAARLLPVIALLLVCLPPASAQGGLDIAAPAQIDVPISAGFQPDPLRVPALVIGGGLIDSNLLGVGGACSGFISEAPDVRITLDVPIPYLRLIFIADTVTSDTTLLVRAPDGTVYCNNNAFGLLNPLVDVLEAPPGDYTVWVGGFVQGEPVYGALHLTSNENVRPGSTGILAPVQTFVPTPDPTRAGAPPVIAGTTMNEAAPPVHGQASLQTGFLPDPAWALAIGGGYVAVPALDGLPPGVSECAGFVESQPDYRLTWSGAGTRLRFHFVPSPSRADTAALAGNAALIVRRPDGTYACNRNFAPGGFTEPSVEVTPQTGTYDIWIASEDAPGVPILGVLYMTELVTTPLTVVSAITTPLDAVTGPDPTATAIQTVLFETTSIDPIVIPLTPPQIGSPDQDLTALNSTLRNPDTTPVCRGFVTVTPTVAINSTAAYPYLRMFYISDIPDVDAVLVARTSDGRWFCGDDALDTLNPMIDIVGEAALGVTQIWVGTYTPDIPMAGRLIVTRGRADPLNPTRAAAIAGLNAFTQGMIPPPTPLPTLPGNTVVVPTLPPMQVTPLNVQIGFPTITPPGFIEPSLDILQPEAAPNFGEVALETATEPHRVNAVAGGDLDAAALGGECVGYVTANPDYRVIWNGPATTLRFYFTGMADASMVVMDPQGRVSCNDDAFATVSPALDIASAPRGAYNVWLGTPTVFGDVSGILHVTEDLNRSLTNP
jgi:hypothetical protein